MEKNARKPSADPIQERLRQDKANWNKEVSAFVNDLIHLKKMMNGWPSKFHKERSRIIDPIPADPNTVIGSLASDFQEIANRGHSIVQEQIEYAKNRRKKQPKQLNLPLEQKPTTPTTEAPPAPVDLTKQLTLPGIAASGQYELIKIAAQFETKYLETEASNPVSRFITRLMTPRIGFGEGARIRQLRRTLLDACAKTNKELKRLHKEIVKSSKDSIPNSHKIMNAVWNHWSIVYRAFTTFKMLSTQPVKDNGGQITPLPDSEKENVVTEPAQTISPIVDKKEEKITQTTQNKQKALLPPITDNDSPEDMLAQAQLGRWIGKVRHQLVPGSTSGARLEVYRLIDETKRNLNYLMDLIESGFDEKKLEPAIGQVHRNITTLRTMVRSLHYSEKPGETSPMPFF